MAGSFFVSYYGAKSPAACSSFLCLPFEIAENKKRSVLYPESSGMGKSSFAFNIYAVFVLSWRVSGLGILCVRVDSCWVEHFFLFFFGHFNSTLFFSRDWYHIPSQRLLLAYTGTWLCHAVPWLCTDTLLLRWHCFGTARSLDGMEPGGDAMVQGGARSVSDMGYSFSPWIGAVVDIRPSMRKFDPSTLLSLGDVKMTNFFILPLGVLLPPPLHIGLQLCDFDATS